MDKINLIIPCAGAGQRFIDAGYDEFKPLISVFGKPMIQHVIGAFPESTIKWIITTSKHKMKLAEVFQNDTDVRFIIIEPHKMGPAWSLLQAADKLPHEEPCFVVYNDVIWKWDFSAVMKFMHSQNADGVVFINTGFHPHLYKNKFSAFCKTDGDILVEIKEKGCFTENWMQEALSTGVYYFSNLGAMLINVQQLVERNMMSAGEYYPSEIFNLMLKHGQKVIVYNTDKFVHAGIPEQLMDAEEWRVILNAVNKPHDLPTLIMMCGTGERMRSFSAENKAGLMVSNRPMFRFVAEKNGSSDNTFLVNDETCDLPGQERQSLNIHVQTISQTESLKLAARDWKNNNGMFVLSTDCYGIYDAKLLNDLEGYSLVLFGFRPRLLQKKQGNAHSGFSFKGNDVSEIHIKSLLPGDLGLAGMYYFPDMNVLKELDSIDCSELNAVDHFADYLLNKGHKIACLPLQYYVHLGTPEELDEYNFWNNYFNE